MIRGALTAVPMVLALCGCLFGRVETSRVLTGPAGPPYAGPVAIVMENAPPPASFVEVGILQAIGYGTYANLARIVESLQGQAAGLGCDAVIRVHVDQGSSQASGTGICVRTAATWTAPAPPPPR
ncbi:MAG: hypothetical protein HY907_13300 [Deltaproteobacteria bacterium]|nr:hypothetical protein [Deltaproteobacteria bacterium]